METPKEVKDCVCDVAELIYKAEQYGGSDVPGPLASYGMMERQVHMTCLALSTQKKENARRLRKS